MNPWCISIDSQVQKLKCILRSTIDGLFIHYSLKHTEMTDQVSVRKLNRGDVCMLACAYDGILKKSETNCENAFILHCFFIQIILLK